MQHKNLISHNVRLEWHEYFTISYFLDRDKHIELIPPSHTPGTHSPDLIMDGVAWEVKTPRGKAKTTIERTLHRAARQSENVILDLRLTNLSKSHAIKLVSNFFQNSQRIHHIQLIIKPNKLFDFRKHPIKITEIY